MSAPRPGGPDAAYAPGELLVKFKPAAEARHKALARSDFSGELRQTFRSRAEHWRLGKGVDVEKAVQRLRSNPLVEYAEPNYYVHTQRVPNDPRYPELWGMNNTGQTGGTPGADIDAVLAWNVSTGSPNVVVGVIDTGCDYNHPDLAPNIWTNPGEIPGNLIDDDANGFVDDVHGYDFVNSDGDPFDDEGHGSHCSGTIAGVGDNGIGVTGVGWTTKIMCIKFLDSGGGGTYAAATAAVDYSTQMGVTLTSNSWGGSGFSQTLYDAVGRAAAADIAFVAAAGNAGSNNDTTPYYPTNFDHANMFSVAATDDTDAKASFSNWGATTVDLAAPGVDILSVQPGNSYQLLSGTSMATPHVAGTLALMKAVSPGVSVALMRARLLSMVDPIPAMAGRCVSGGRLNAFRSIADPDVIPPGAVSDLATVDPGSNTMGLTWTATGDDGIVGTAAYYDLRYSTAPIDDTNWADAATVSNEPMPQASGSSESMEVGGLLANTFYYFALKAFDEWGNGGPISNLASGTTLASPTADVAPASVEASLYTGQETDSTVVLSNIGVGTLDFTIPNPTVGEPYTAVYDPVILPKDELDPRHGPVPAGSGGPDAFGYRWVDSDEPGGPAFSWVDISTTGTPLGLTGDDVTSAPITLGFNFPYYGTFFDSIRVCSNGWLSFTSSSSAYSNQPLPNSGAPENLVAPFWDDMNPGGVNRTYFQSFGNRAIVQWEAMPHYGTAEPGTYTFQAILDASGAITFQYNTMVGTLSSSTIGIQNDTKTTGLQVAYNVGYVHDGLAVRIASIPQWLSAFPTSGRLRGGESKIINIHMNASGLEGGNYPGTVNILTNDPAHAILPVSALLHVTGAPEANVQPESLAYGDVFVGVATPRTLIVANAGTDVLHVSDVVASDPQLVVSPTTFDVPPHASQNVTVTWTPVTPGPYTGSVTVMSNDSSNPAILVPAAGNGLVAPQMVFAPTSLSETLYTGHQSTQQLTVYNTGGSALVVNAAADLGGGELIYASGPGALGEGGPDGYKYKWKDSDASGGPVFNWIDISSTGTALTITGDDSTSALIPMGMTFPFYGVPYTQVKVCTNGWISFDTGTSTVYTNTALPSTTLLPNSIALFWDDLYFRTAGGSYPRTSRAYYQYDGSKFIIQYKNVYNRGTTEDLNFEVILYPNGKIVMQYQTMTGTLNSATVGIHHNRTATPLDFLQMAYNSTYIKNNLAIQISRTPDWLKVTPASATIPPGGSSVFDVLFDSTDRMGGLYTGAVVLTNNLPETKRVPATLTVTGSPVVDINPDFYDFGTKFVGYSHLTSFYVVNEGSDVLNVTDITTSHGSLTVYEPTTDEVWPNAAFPLPPNTSRLFNLRWQPTMAGPLAAAVQVYSDDPVTPVKIMPVTGNALIPPAFLYSPASYTESLMSGDVVHRLLHLENQGGSDLTYNIEWYTMTGAVVPVFPPREDLKKDEPDDYPGVLGGGGPDSYGYRWKDSNALNGPVFDWVDISGVGTPITFNVGTRDDGNATGIPIGFPFPFYSGIFNTVNVCTNGWLSFTNTTTSLSNYGLPSTSAPENLLAAFWDDMDLRTSGEAYYYNDGGRFIVSYVAMPRYSSGGPYTFEVILYPSGRIVYQYLSMQGTRLNEATIGIQNATKTDGLLVAYNAAYVQNNLAVAFVPPARYLAVTPSSGTIPAGMSADLDVAIDSTGVIDGDYAAMIDIATNDPMRTLSSIPVNIHVTGIPDINANPASLTFPMTYVGYSHTLPLTIANVGTKALNITDVVVTGDFAVAGLTAPVTLPVYGSIPVTVAFSPTAPGDLVGEITLVSDDPDEASFVIPLAGLALTPPVVGVAPPSLDELLPPGGTSTQMLTVCNTGGSDLVWNGVTNILSAAVAMPTEPTMDFPKEELDPRPGILGSGGPDGFGYKWKDSDEPGGPVFDWVDIGGIGTQITQWGTYRDDGNVGPFPIGFPFKFYGNTFETFRVSTNGWISFTSTSTSYSNQNLPTGGTYPENLIAPFWDDMVYDESYGSSAWYYFDGTRLIVQFDTFRRIAEYADPFYTFQIILYPSGRVVFQYLSLAATTNQCTVGIQNATRDVGLPVAFNAYYLHDNMAIEFKTIPEWLLIAPNAGTIPAGGCQDMTVSFDATDPDLLHGVHDATIHFTSNDPATPVVDVPVQLVVDLPPTADAGEPQILECTDHGAVGTLNGLGSSDPDSDPLAYAWTAPGIVFDDPTSPTPTATFPMGTTEATLVVNDGWLDSEPDTTSVTVRDTLPPVLVCPPSVTVECQHNQRSFVTLPLATAVDQCEGPVAIENDRPSWHHTCQDGANASGWYKLGTTTVTFTAVDSLGQTSTCQTSITVQDTTPPVVKVVAEPHILWPPDRRMRSVRTVVIAKDACDPSPHHGNFGDPGDGSHGGWGWGAGSWPYEVEPTNDDSIAQDFVDPLNWGGNHGDDCRPPHPNTPHILLTSVTSNEVNDSNDIRGADIGTPDFQMYLRAERERLGTGRVYTLTYQGFDDAGNFAYGTGEVKVPISLRPHGEHDLDPHRSGPGFFVTPPQPSGEEAP